MRAASRRSCGDRLRASARCIRARSRAGSRSAAAAGARRAAGRRRGSARPRRCPRPPACSGSTCRSRRRAPPIRSRVSSRPGGSSQKRGRMRSGMGEDRRARGRTSASICVDQRRRGRRSSSRGADSRPAPPTGWRRRGRPRSRRGRSRSSGPRRRTSGARRGRRRRRSVPGDGAVEHVDLDRIDAEAGRVQPGDGHVRGRIAQLAPALLAVEHLALDPVPVAEHRGGVAGPPLGQSAARIAVEETSRRRRPRPAARRSRRIPSPPPSAAESPARAGAALAEAEVRRPPPHGRGPGGPRRTSRDEGLGRQRGEGGVEGQLVRAGPRPASRAGAPWPRRSSGGRAGASGAKYSRGWGSKVTTPRGRPARAASRARPMTAWWPRCTPSKLPMAAAAPRARAGWREVAEAAHGAGDYPCRTAGPQPMPLVSGVNVLGGPGGRSPAQRRRPMAKGGAMPSRRDLGVEQGRVRLAAGRRGRSRSPRGRR